jgi:hypothetical protein
MGGNKKALSDFPAINELILHPKLGIDHIVGVE